MPFDISSAPEVLQRKMHKIITDLHGTEVVADDFVVVGMGSTWKKVIQEQNNNF